MTTMIVEDRTLARIALEVAGQTTVAASEKAADIALGQAVIKLRVLGVPTGPEILRTVRADIEAILADPAELARARAITAGSAQTAASNISRAVPLGRAA